MEKLQTKLALALRHVAFEDLDGFARPLEKHGFQVRYWDAWKYPHDFDPLTPEVLVVLGAPCGVYEKDEFPFIAHEVEAVRRRLEADRPVLGICFGAQILAEAMGAKVYPGPKFEFGWSELAVTAEGACSPIRHFHGGGRNVFHCHGDTFDLPIGATRLASTSEYENQAFQCGRHLATQFHAEVTEPGLRRWYIGHAARARTSGGISKLRNDTEALAPVMAGVHDAMLSQWLEEIGLTDVVGEQIGNQREAG